MCGICGIAIPERLQRPVDQARLARMRDSIVHRGPDGAGMFMDGSIGLGHRRLSIVDVAHGAQPMTTDDGRSTIVYNGEVFNHPALMASLQAQGVSYHTHCDTETVLHLYARHGREFVQHCRGMFAIAIWDRADRTLTLARDRFGVKPLYYAHAADGTLHFASEIKALLASGAVTATLDMASFPDFLANHAPSGNDTLFEGVKRLPAGHTLRWRDGDVTIEQYWDLSFTPDADLARSSDADLVAEYSRRFEEAVRLRLMADVPLGMFLSGGIDSAAITAVMSDMVQGPIKTFSVAFAEREANELRYARIVSERYRTDHHEIVVTPEQFWDALPQLIWHEDEPIAHPSSVALNFVSRLAGEHVKVVLTGEGSDETLAGYNRYRVTVANMQLGGMWEKVVPGAVRNAVSGAIGEAGAAGVRGKLARTFLARPANLDAMYFDNFAVFAPGRLSALLTSRTREAVAGIDAYAAYHDAIDRSDAPTLLGKLLYADTKTYLHELLMKQDQMSMAASIESRVPFLDHPLAEFAARMPERMKLRGMTTKWVLRQAMKDRLPEEILSRKKMGFPVPVGAWFRGEWRHLLDEFVTSERTLSRGHFQPDVVRRMVAGHVAGENHTERLWALLTLEIWQRIFLDGEDPASISMRPASAVVSLSRPVAA
ncbi:MAG TPA: asparagine synthase (glutamine-hydrolyzing) [Gemmatimonadaceae bacterium]|nr:asparagine synthase (glutamine-hydrolyzing) [Gemmatimonadaceae bacterium]